MASSSSTGAVEQGPCTDRSPDPSRRQQPSATGVDEDADDDGLLPSIPVFLDGDRELATAIQASLSIDHSSQTAPSLLVTDQDQVAPSGSALAGVRFLRRSRTEGRVPDAEVSQILSVGNQTSRTNRSGQRGTNYEDEEAALLAAAVEASIADFSDNAAATEDLANFEAALVASSGQSTSVHSNDLSYHINSDDVEGLLLSISASLNS